MGIKFIKSNHFSFDGWNIFSFLKGRKKLLITGIGYGVGYLVTNHPVYAGIVAAAGDLIVAIIEYFVKEY